MYEMDEIQNNEKDKQEKGKMMNNKKKTKGKSGTTQKNKATQ